jgi:hypothetical protein
VPTRKDFWPRYPKMSREAVDRVDDVLRYEISEAAGDGDLDDDEVVVLLRQRRLRHWLGRLSDPEAAEALGHRLKLLGDSLEEFAGFMAMVVERHPELRVPVARVEAKVIDELERMFANRAER